VTQAHSDQLQKSLQKSETKYDQAEQARIQLQGELAEMRTQYNRIEQERIRLEMELQDAKEKLENAQETSHPAGGYSDPKPTPTKENTHEISALTMGPGEFIHGYPREPKSGRIELDNNHELDMNGTVTRKAEVQGHPAQPKARRAVRP